MRPVVVSTTVPNRVEHVFDVQTHLTVSDLEWMPAAAVYFRDPDGHLIEYLAMLDEPACPSRGIVAWSRWASADPRLVAGAAARVRADPAGRETRRAAARRAA